MKEPFTVNISTSYGGLYVNVGMNQSWSYSAPLPMTMPGPEAANWMSDPSFADDGAAQRMSKSLGIAIGSIFHSLVKAIIAVEIAWDMWSHPEPNTPAYENFLREIVTRVKLGPGREVAWDYAKEHFRMKEHQHTVIHNYYEQSNAASLWSDPSSNPYKDLYEQHHTFMSGNVLKSANPWSDKGKNSGFTATNIKEIIRQTFKNVDVQVMCPACEDSDAPIHPTTTSLLDMVVILNDQHKWSREEIAEWIRLLDIDTTTKEEE